MCPLSLSEFREGFVELSERGSPPGDDRVRGIYDGVELLNLFWPPCRSRWSFNYCSNHSKSADHISWSPILCAGYSRLLAQELGGQLAGIVLVDATPEDFASRLPSGFLSQEKLMEQLMFWEQYLANSEFPDWSANHLRPPFAYRKK